MLILHLWHTIPALHGGMVPFQLTDILIVMFAACTGRLFIFFVVLVGSVVQPARAIHVVIVRGALRVRLFTVNVFGWVAFEFPFGGLCKREIECDYVTYDTTSDWKSLMWSLELYEVKPRRKCLLYCEENCLAHTKA